VRSSPRGVVAQCPRDVAGQPQPPQLVFLGERLLAERAQRVLEHGRPGDVPLTHRERETIEQLVARARRRPPACGEHRCSDLARVATLHEPVGRQRGGERLEVRLAREIGVQRFQPLRCLDQQRRSVATARHREGDLRMQQLRPRILELVQRTRARHRQQSQRGVGRTRLMLCAGGDQCALRAAPGIRGQCGGSLVEGGPGCQAPARPRARCRALQLGRDVLVEPGRRLGEVPGAAIGVRGGIGGVGEHAVHAPSLLGLGR
jgi:hypothetical protein